MADTDDPRYAQLYWHYANHFAAATTANGAPLDAAAQNAYAHEHATRVWDEEHPAAPAVPPAAAVIAPALQTSPWVQPEAQPSDPLAGGRPPAGPQYGSPSAPQYASQPVQQFYATAYGRPVSVDSPDGPRYGATFGEAFVRFWRRGFTFTGRASLSEFWWSYLATTLSVMVLYVLLLVFTGVTAAVASDSSSAAVVVPVAIIGLLMMLFAVAIIIPSLAVTVRRLHDTDRSGLYYFMGFIPLAGSIILLVLLCGASNPNGARFDAR